MATGDGGGYGSPRQFGTNPYTGRPEYRGSHEVSFESYAALCRHVKKLIGEGKVDEANALLTKMEVGFDNLAETDEVEPSKRGSWITTSGASSTISSGNYLMSQMLNNASYAVTLQQAQQNVSPLYVHDSTEEERRLPSWWKKFMEKLP